MAQRVAAIFPTREAADRAAQALVDLGADREHVSMLARGDEGEVTTAPAAYRTDDDTDFVEPAREVGDSGAPMTTADEDEAAKGAAAGATIGAVAGLAAGLAALLVPGFGLVMAAGPLAWALGGAAGTAAAGAIAGGVYGGLRDVGIEEHHARGYEERIRTGDVLLTALIPSIAEDRVLDVLAEHGAEDISFADDTATAERYIAPTATTSPDYRTTDVTDRTMAAPPAAGAMAAPVTTMPSEVGVAPTTGYNRDIARGEAKQTEGEIRDRAADATLNPMDDLAAKAKKAEGKIQEEYGEATASVRTPSAGYNEEASLRADDTGTVRTTTSAFEAATTHPRTDTADHTVTQSYPVAGQSEFAARDRTDRDDATASYAESPVGASATTGAAFNPNIARGEAKQAEGEIRDRAADRTANPMDDLAAKAKKAEGKVQEEYGEAEETIERRRV